MAPEILKSQEYDASLDIWCLGIITYELLFLRSPFEFLPNEPRMRILDKISSVEINYEVDNIKISESAKDFLCKVKFFQLL